MRCHSYQKRVLFWNQKTVLAIYAEHISALVTLFDLNTGTYLPLYARSSVQQQFGKKTVVFKMTSLKKHKCETCNVSFDKLHRLNRHFETAKAHNKDPTHICHQCNKSYFTSSALRLHTKTSHGSGPKKTFDCNLCEKKGSISKSLRTKSRRLNISCL